MLELGKYRYQVYGLAVASEFEMKELDEDDISTSVDLNVKFADLGLLKPNSEPKFSFSENTQVVVLPAVGAFVIHGTHTVLVEPKPGISTDFLAVPFLGPVLAIVLHLRNKFLLHGSAVVFEGKAYGFVGDKGAGKSTLAAMLLKNEGVQLLTDDLLVVSNDLEVLRGYPQLKLSDEAMHNFDRSMGTLRPPPIAEFPKQQFLLSAQKPNETVPVGGIFELTRGEETQIAELTAAEAIRVLLRFSYIARFGDRKLSQRERLSLFEITNRISSSGRVKRIQVPRRIKDLEAVIDTIRMDAN